MHIHWYAIFSQVPFYAVSGAFIVWLLRNSRKDK
jgi:hypothetical protein